MGLDTSGLSDCEMGGERGFVKIKGVRDDRRSIGVKLRSEGTLCLGGGVTARESGGVICESRACENADVGSEAYPSISRLSALTPP